MILSILSLTNIHYFIVANICVLAIYIGRNNQDFAWILLSFCLFSASLSEFQNQFVLDPPDLVFPLEQIRSMGRPLTALLIGLLFLIGFNKKELGISKHLIPSPIKFLLLIQIIVFMKRLEGDWRFAVSLALTYFATLVMLLLGPNKWLNKNNLEISNGIQSVAISAIIFLAANGIQALFDIYPIMFVQNRFMGTTGNPQHAGTLLSLSLPCCLYCYEIKKKRIAKYFWLASLIVISYSLFLTGSRTGVLMALVTLLVFYRNRVNSLIQLSLITVFIFLVGSLFFELDLSSVIFWDATLSERFTTDLAVNTRAGPWTSMWRIFLENPLFGAPLKGDQLGFGESSWLAAGANFGILGFIPLLLFAIQTIKMMFQLNTLATMNPFLYFESSAIISVFSSVLVGSFSESFLFGSLTFPMITLLLFCMISQKIIDNNS